MLEINIELVSINMNILNDNNKDFEYLNEKNNNGPKR